MSSHKSASVKEREGVSSARGMKKYYCSACGYSHIYKEMIETHIHYEKEEEGVT